jgi:hypothetical protein
MVTWSARDHVFEITMFPTAAHVSYCHIFFACVYASQNCVGAGGHGRIDARAKGAVHERVVSLTHQLHLCKCNVRSCSSALNSYKRHFLSGIRASMGSVNLSSMP